MWRKIETIEDCRKFFLTAEQADPSIWYRVSENKGQLEADSNRMLTLQVVRKDYGQWIYEDGENVCAFQYLIEGNLGKIQTCVAVGFAPDIFTNCKMALPIIVKKIREEMVAHGINRFYAKSPRTKYGEVMAYLASIYLKEATVSLIGDDTAWLIDFDLSKKADDDLGLSVQKETSPIEPDLKPVDFNPKLGDKTSVSADKL